MHELSIARSLVRLVEHHRPAGSIVKALRVQVGPLQAIVPDAMQLAWQAATLDTDLAGAELQLQLLPWRLRCPDCKRQWDADTRDAYCECGSLGGVPIGGDDLLLEYIEAVEPAERHAHSTCCPK